MLVVGGVGLVDAVAHVGLTPVMSADDEPVAIVQWLGLTGIDRVPRLLVAPPLARPTFLGVDLDDLGRAQPDCSPYDGGWRCGGASAGACQRHVEVAPTGPSDGGPQEALEGVRAVCSLVWASRGEVDPDLAAAALRAWTAPHGWDR